MAPQCRTWIGAGAFAAAAALLLVLHARTRSKIDARVQVSPPPPVLPTPPPPTPAPTAPPPGAATPAPLLDLSASVVTGAGSGLNPCFRAPPGVPRVEVKRDGYGKYAVAVGDAQWGVLQHQSGEVLPAAKPSTLPYTRFAIYVPSGVGMADRRVRQRAWMKHQPDFANASLCTVRFAIGEAPDAAKAKQLTAEEQKTHGDLAYLPCTDLDVPGRSATAEKVLMSVHHAVRTLRFDWFVRGADDAWINLNALSYLYAIHHKTPRVYAGMILRRKREVGSMRGHWPRGFLPYASGLGYVLGADLSALIAARLHDGESCFNVAWPEDAASGYWVANFFPTAIHNTAAFGDYDHKDWCPHTVAILHKPTGDVWDALVKCGRPVRCDFPAGMFVKQIGWGGPWMPVKCRGRTSRPRMVRRRR